MIEKRGDVCQVIVNRGDGRYTALQQCGRLVERDGKCKLHLRVEARRAEKDKQFREKWARGEQLQAEADVISARLGIEVRAHYNTIRSEYDGRFVVDGDWLREQA